MSIYLNENKKNYILIDQQGTEFCNHVIFEGIEELAEQFISYAETDEYDDPTLKGATVQQMLYNWGFDCKVYDGKDWVELSESELNYIHNK
jgi:hypothetical protein